MHDDVKVSRSLPRQSVATASSPSMTPGGLVRLAVVIALLPALCVLSACPPAPIIGTSITVTVSPSGLSLTAGTTGTLTVSVGAGGSQSKEVSWSSSNLAVAQVTPLNSTTAQVLAVTPGTATITATSVGDSKITSSSAVTVTAPPPALTAFTISPKDFPLLVGSTQQLVPNPTPGGAGVTVTYGYVSSATSVAQVSGTGLVTGLSQGIAVITATANGTGTGFSPTQKTDNTTVTVSPLPAACTSMTLDPRTASIGVGATQQVNATAQRAAGTVTAVYGFVSSNTAVATVNSSGLVTGVANGSTNILVTATCSGTGFANVTLNDQVALTVTAPDAVLALTVAPATATIPSNGVQQLTPTPTKANAGVVMTYQYVSSTPSVASVNLNTGLVTAVAAGSTVITVTGTGTLTGFNSNSKVATSSITVTQAGAACTAATLTPPTATIAVGGNTTLVGTSTTASGAVVVVSSFASSAITVATVNAAGTVQGVAPGNATITYTGTCSGGGFNNAVVTATTSVTVTPATAPLLSSWTLQRTGGPVLATWLWSGWAPDAQNIFVAGFDNVDANVGAMWRSSDGGTTWSRVMTTLSDVKAVSGTSLTNVWALTASGEVWRSTGGAFALFRAADPPAQCCWRDLVAIGTSVFMVGSGGRINRSVSGGAFAAMTSGTVASLSGVAASSETNVYAVSDSAASIVLKWDGVSWTRPSLAPTVDSRFYDVWVGGPSSVIAVGGNSNGSGGREARFNGTTWTTSAIAGTSYLFSIAGTSTADLWAVDYNATSNVLRNTGAGWSYLSPAAPWNDLNVIVQTTQPNVGIALGWSVGSVQRLASGVWTVHSAASNLTDVSVATTTAAFAVGNANAILRWNGTTWSTWASPGFGGQSIWALGAADALISNAGTVQRYTNGAFAGQWSVTNANFFDMWGSSPTSVYAVGSAGIIAKWNGSALTQMASPTGNALMAVFGFSDNEIYAGGSTGALIKYNGAAWTTMLSPTAIEIDRIWGSSGADLYLGDVQGGVWRSTNSGASWTNVGTIAAGFNGFNAGFSNSATDSYVIGRGVNRYVPGTGFALLATLPATPTYASGTAMSGIPGLGLAIGVGPAGAIWTGRSAGSIMASMFGSPFDPQSTIRAGGNVDLGASRWSVGPRRDALSRRALRGGMR